MTFQHFKYLLTQGVLYALLFATTHLDADNIYCYETHLMQFLKDLCGLWALQFRQ